MRSFFIITGGPDGTYIDGPISEDILLRRITPNRETGDTHYCRETFLSEVPDLDYFPEDAMVIIEGKIVIPEEHYRTVEYKI